MPCTALRYGKRVSCSGRTGMGVVEAPWRGRYIGRRPSLHHGITREKPITPQLAARLPAGVFQSWDTSEFARNVRNTNRWQEMSSEAPDTIAWAFESGKCIISNWPKNISAALVGFHFRYFIAATSSDWFAMCFWMSATKTRFSRQNKSLNQTIDVDNSALLAVLRETSTRGLY